MPVPPRPVTIPSLDLLQLRRTCRACALHDLCLPASIGPEELGALDAIVRARRPLDRGQVLFAGGTRFQALYVVRSGSFKTTLAANNGEEQVLGFHLPGEVIGFDALADDVHRCNAEALERSSVCEVPFAQIDEFATRVPGLYHQLMRIASREVVRDHEHLAMMGRKQAQERLAVFLRNLSERYRALHRAPDLIELSMSRHELANYLGLVVETASRLFTRFEEAGVLSVNRKQIRILDFARLDDFAGEPPPSCERAAG
ncbi:MAG: fumarate/nitrate reduction transcriptional regulator Fnr [Xanthomonadales bacterium]|nr:fumarate/nitrate reduction transcriptional regulator Fnr [Xanthomonadales bacterium]